MGFVECWEWDWDKGLTKNGERTLQTCIGNFGLHTCSNLKIKRINFSSILEFVFFSHHKSCLISLPTALKGLWIRHWFWVWWNLTSPNRYKWKRSRQNIVDFFILEKISFCLDIFLEEVKHFLVSLTSSPYPSVCCHFTFHIRRKLEENHKGSIFSIWTECCWWHHPGAQVS